MWECGAWRRLWCNSRSMKSSASFAWWFWVFWVFFFLGCQIFYQKYKCDLEELGDLCLFSPLRYQTLCVCLQPSPVKSKVGIHGIPSVIPAHLLSFSTSNQLVLIWFFMNPKALPGYFWGWVWSDVFETCNQFLVWLNFDEILFHPLHLWPRNLRNSPSSLNNFISPFKNFVNLPCSTAQHGSC